MERTYIMVKPDGVERRLVGEIIRRFETRGLRLIGLKMLIPDRSLAEAHYAVHKEKPFFGELVDFIPDDVSESPLILCERRLRVRVARVRGRETLEANPSQVVGFDSVVLIEEVKRSTNLGEPSRNFELANRFSASGSQRKLVFVLYRANFIGSGFKTASAEDQLCKGYVLHPCNRPSQKTKAPTLRSWRLAFGLLAKPGK